MYRGEDDIASLRKKNPVKERIMVNLQVSLNIAKTLTNRRCKLQRKWVFNPFSEPFSSRNKGRNDRVFVWGYVNPAKRAGRTDFEPSINAVNMKTMVTYRQRSDFFPFTELAKAHRAIINFMSHTSFSDPLLN